MSPFDALAGCVISTVQSVFGSATAFAYSRLARGNVDAVAPFSIKAAFDTGGDFASPTGAVSGRLLVKIADIPGGPMKGDVVTIATPPTGMHAGGYTVQDIYADPGPGWAALELRWTGQ